MKPHVWRGKAKPMAPCTYADGSGKMCGIPQMLHGIPEPLELADMDALEVTVTDAELADWCIKRGVATTTTQVILCAHAKVVQVFKVKGTLGTGWEAEAMDDPPRQTWLVKFTRS